MEQVIEYIKTNPAEVGLIVTAIFLAITGKWRDALALLMAIFKTKPEPALMSSTAAPAEVAYLDHLLAEYKTQLLAHDHVASDATHAKIQSLCKHDGPVVEPVKP